jgi:coenzyme F420-reducing hydrogenase delta subunit
MSKEEYNPKILGFLCNWCCYAAADAVLLLMRQVYHVTSIHPTCVQSGLCALVESILHLSLKA